MSLPAGVLRSKPVTQGDEVHLAAEKVVEQGSQPPRRAAKPIQPPDDHGLDRAGLDPCPELPPARPIHSLAGELVAERDDRAIVGINPPLQVGLLRSSVLLAT
jgi:hypothetical protein